MSTIPGLTVAIITFKRSDQLQSCLDSFLKQKYRPQEILLIDNDYLCSAKDVSSRYSSNLPLRYLPEPIKGISRCRNLALNTCKTSLIAFIDDDCCLSSDWSEQVRLILNSKSRFSFIQGGLEKPRSAAPLIKAQDIRYREWIGQNSSIFPHDPEKIDTKNLILDLDDLRDSSIKFDTSLPIFEDVDLGMQIKKAGLSGLYCPSIKVSHPYPCGLGTLLRKTYYQGKIRYLFDKKWKLVPATSSLYDLNWGHNPISTHLACMGNLLRNIYKVLSIGIKTDAVSVLLYRCLLDVAFDQGYLRAKRDRFTLPPTVLLLNRYDKSANEERSRKVHQYLVDRNIATSIVDTDKVFNEHKAWKTALLISPLVYLLYKSCHMLLRYFNSTFLVSLSYLLEMVLRGWFIGHYLKDNSTSVIICQYSEDIFSAFHLSNKKVLLDLPTIYSYELKLSQRYSPIIIWLIEKLEQQTYLKAQAVCFHWYSFTALAHAHNKKFRKLFTLNWGCSPTKVRAQYQNKPHLVYLGNVNSEWINPPLLNQLSRSSIFSIDTYSYDTPNPKLYPDLKSKGFLTRLDKLSHYQFGLITISNDELRNNGFSAKYLTYLSYGLPVLCPEWRRDPLLEPATIYYNHKNFNQQLTKYSKKRLWLEKHQQALKLAQQLYWNNTLQPLEKEIYSLIN